jgi:hypothetical protein
MFNLKFEVMNKKELLSAIRNYLKNNSDQIDDFIDEIKFLKKEVNDEIDNDIKEWAKSD